MLIIKDVKNTFNEMIGGEDGTRTHIPKAPEPKSGASTNFATSPRDYI